MLSRRELIGKAAVGAAAALAVGGVVGTGIAATRPLRKATDEPGTSKDAVPGDGEVPKEPPPHTESAELTAPAPWGLLAPFSAGAIVAHGWRLVDVTPVQHGSAIVTLQNARGRAHRIHLCRNDGTPQGLVHTRRVDLVVMNEGHGGLPTEENLGQAVAELAHRIAANETWAPGHIFTALLPHAERVNRFAAASDPWAAGKLR